jgi:hypothetical protein
MGSPYTVQAPEYIVYNYICSVQRLSAVYCTVPEPWVHLEQCQYLGTLCTLSPLVPESCVCLDQCQHLSTLCTLSPQYPSLVSVLTSASTWVHCIHYPLSTWVLCLSWSVPALEYIVYTIPFSTWALDHWVHCVHYHSVQQGYRYLSLGSVLISARTWVHCVHYCSRMCEILGALPR